ncbi:MAG TPA: ribonuclease III [Bacteroidales bacterium]|nr:ribonuclease III [Bacteroidales bacterium]
MFCFGYFKAIFSPDRELYLKLKNIFGFYPNNISIYQLAFRHKSCALRHFNGIRISNERLEFLGDAVLDAIIADHLFKLFPYKDEGFLTQMKSKIVSRNHLNKLSSKLGIDKLIQCSQETIPHHKSMKGDAFEAFIGALYLDKGYRITRSIIIDRIIRLHVDMDEMVTMDTNFKSRLLEWTQREKKTLEFKVIDEVGSGYHKQYIVELLIDQVVFGRGQDYSIKAAEQQAAEKALEKISV